MQDELLKFQRELYKFINPSRGFLKNLLFFIMSLILVFGFSLTIETLIESINHYFHLPLSFKLILGFVILIVGLRYYYFRIKEIHEKGIYEIEELSYDNFRKIKILITGLSASQSIYKQLEEFREIVKKHAGDKEKIIKDPEVKLPWIQQAAILLKLEEFKAPLEKIIVIPSKESAEFKEKFIEFVSLLFPQYENLIEFSDPVNYEEVQEVQKTITHISRKLKESNFKDNEILIDVTPGLKLFSIVLAGATFDNPKKFCYVNLERIPKIFDMTLKILEKH